MNYTDSHVPSRVLAEEYGLTATQIRVLVIRREVVGFQGGSDYFVTRDSLLAWLAKNASGTEAQ